MPIGSAYVMYNPNLASPKDLIDAVARPGNDDQHEYRAQVINYLGEGHRSKE